MLPHPGPEGHDDSPEAGDEIVARYTAFRELHRDQGTNSGSKVVLEVCRLFTRRGPPRTILRAMDSLNEVSGSWDSASKQCAGRLDRNGTSLCHSS